MKLTRRQEEAVNQIITEEVEGALNIRHERERLLDQAVINEAKLEGRLVSMLEDAIDEVGNVFIRANRWNPNIERDFDAPKAAWEEACRTARKELIEVIEDKVREVGQALAEGMYAPDEDKDEAGDEVGPEAMYGYGSSARPKGGR